MRFFSYNVIDAQICPVLGILLCPIGRVEEEHLSKITFRKRGLIYTQLSYRRKVIKGLYEKMGFPQMVRSKSAD